MDAATFRQDYPEFGSTSDYPDAQVNLWLSMAAKMLNADRWGDILDLGLCLYTAHHLALGRRDVIAAASGGIPGSIQGVLTSKSVDKVSAAYDASSITNPEAGFWNGTIYGVRLYNLARLMGAGGVQL